MCFSQTRVFAGFYLGCFGPTNLWTLLDSDWSGKNEQTRPLKRAKRGVRLQSTNRCAAVGGSICSLGWFKQSIALCINAGGFHHCLTRSISTFIVILSHLWYHLWAAAFKSLLLVLFIYYIIVCIHVLNKRFYVLIGQQHICQKDDWMTVI